MCVPRVKTGRISHVYRQHSISIKVSYIDKKSSKSEIDKIPHPTHGLCVVKGKPTLESQYAPVAGSSSEEESLLISISIFYLYKEQKYSFKRLAVVTLFTFGVSNFLHVHFHHEFWFISVR